MTLHLADVFTEVAHAICLKQADYRSFMDNPRIALPREQYDLLFAALAKRQSLFSEIYIQPTKPSDLEGKRCLYFYGTWITPGDEVAYG